MSLSGPDTAATGDPRDTGRALVLVDYFNSFNTTPTTEGLAYEIDSTLKSILAVAPATTVIDFRYYGGWYESGVLSQAASELLGLLAISDPFPRGFKGDAGTRIIRGTLRLADRIIAAPDFDLGDTLRRRAGLPSFRLAMNGHQLGCPDVEGGCVMRQVAKLTKSPGRSCWVPNCPETVASAFFVREQKMVDSMMTCDLLHISITGLADLVAVETFDTDIIPALVQAAATGTAPVWLRDRNNDWDGSRLASLKAAGVRLL